MASSISASTTCATATAATGHHHPPPNFYFDETWKLSKKEGSSLSLSSSRSSRSGSSNCHKSSNRRCAFSRKCARLVKEQRARFYIVRRCVTMLICWHDYSDS
ncbi:hypothetical protein ABKV19_024035 [Rosa sericea]